MGIKAERRIHVPKRRARQIESTFAGAARHISELHKDLLAFEGKTEDKLKEHDKRFDKIDREIQGLREDIPKIVGDVMREVNAENRRRK